MDPLLHYFETGAAEGRDPNPFFDTDWYTAQYRDVAGAGVNPLLHYLESGAAEGRNPSPRFDSDWYLAQNPEVAARGLNPLAHFLRVGAAEGREPLPVSKATKRATLAQRLAAQREEEREKIERLSADLARLQKELTVGKDNTRRLAADVEKRKAREAKFAADIEERKEKARKLNADVARRRNQHEALVAQLAKREAEAKRLAKVINAFNRADPMPARAAVRNLPSEPRRHPLVSALVLTRNGKHLLDAMLRSLHSVNSYPSLELIIVDHASDDGTRQLLEAWGSFFRLRVIAYDSNHSFAFSNNRAAELAEGELLLLLNNDVIFEGDVIPRMVAALEDERVGAAGAKQYPGPPFSLEDRGPNHIGVRLRWDRAGYLRAYNAVPGPLDGVIAVEPASFPAVTASIFMCRRSDYLALGGLNESYLYGSEDIDFCSKIRLGLGKEIISLNDIDVLHNESTTRSLEERQESGEQRARNRMLLRKRFGYRLRREFKETLLRDDGSLTGKRFVAAFAVTSVDMASGAGDLRAALGLGEALRKLCNWDIRYLPPASWYEAADVDVYVAMSDEIDIRRLVHSPPHLTIVAWLRSGIDRWVGQPWFELFDMRLCSSSAGAKYVSERSGLACELLPMAVSLSVFHPGPPVPEHQADYAIVRSAGANSLSAELGGFEPTRLAYRFAIYGEIPATLAAYRREPVEYGDLPRIYSSAPITVDSEGSADRAGLECGAFDALACGSLVLTNDASGAAESFGDRLPVWGSGEELVRLLDFHLRNPEERQALARSLRDQVMTQHSFDARARDLLRLLTDCMSRYRIAIKCPAVGGEALAEPGFDVARSLAKVFRARGHEVRIDRPDDWDAPRAMADDVIIVVRGAEGYKPAVDQINIGWGMDASAADSAEVSYDSVFIGAATDAFEDGVAVLLDAIEECHSQRMAVPRDPPLSETPVAAGADMGVQPRTSH